MSVAEMRHKMHMQEVENKIKLMRMNWFVNNYEKVFKNPEKPTSAVPTKTADLYEEVLEMRRTSKEIYQKLASCQKEMEGKLKTAKNNLNVAQVANLPVMYPVPPEVRAELYNGISSNGEGRYRYLKIRDQLLPEEKYRLCPTGNYKYGWETKKQNKLMGPEHGRKQVINTTFYRANGITLYEQHPTQRPPNPPGHLVYVPL